MNYTDIKKLDEETLGKLVEGTGPVDECLCSLLSPPPNADDRRSIRSSIKKVLGKVKEGKGMKEGRIMKERKGSKGPKGPKGREVGGRKTHHVVGQGQKIDIPLVFNQDGNLKTTREVVKRKGSCGKCPCDKENLVLQHSFANIRITSPDISTFCPCPTHDCLPGKDREKLKNNITVTIERMTIDPDSENSEISIHRQKTILEPSLHTRSLTSLINAQYETEEEQLS